MQPDLQATRQQMQTGQTTALAEVQEAIAHAKSDRCAHVFLHPTFDEALRTATQPGIERTPLAGLPVSIKDLFDVQGQITRAGSTVLGQAAPALVDSPAVARLRRAGAALMGRTNMTEFAFSGVGINPHYGTPANACDPVTARIPGGSSSGAAVSVATGASFIGLGSDTGGSIRIPAALNGIVGFKGTARLIPTTGAIPLSSTLDTVCALTRSVSDAILAHEILSNRRVIRSTAPLSAYRLGIATTWMLEGLDTTVAAAWQRTIDTLRNAGARIEDVELRAISQLEQIQASGNFSAAESYAWHRQMLDKNVQDYDPRVAFRMLRGAKMSAWEYLELQTARQRWITTMDLALEGFDAILSPTVPMVAPPQAMLAPGAERDEAFFSTNTLLLRNTSMVNMLDGCAISIPCHAPNELPVGLMVWAGALQDDPVLNIARQIELALQ
jgi:Asp-tRNA(Asn)/Glu-tRNA(Gln) amidotransferase A subunit family amidase